MINRISYSITLLIVSVLFSVLAHGQKTVVRASIDKSAIVIGEQINLRLEADIPQNQPIRFFQLDSLPHFEILEQQKIDTTDTDDGTTMVQIIRITSFDSGHWMIPRFELGNVATDSIGVDVGFSPFDPNQPYHDIKDIIEVKPEEPKKKQQWWYYVVGGVVLIVLLLALLLRKKKKPEVLKVDVPPPDAYQLAMAALERLQKEKADTRVYYTKLVDIFRIYVHDKKGIHSMQKTTDDLVLQLRDLNMSKEQFDRLSQSLRLSDFVKFAKYVPTQEDDRSAFDVIKASIDYIEQMQ